MANGYVTKSELTIALAEFRQFVKSDTAETVEKMETVLLTEFHKWAKMTESRMRVNEFGILGLTERILSVEERLSRLEQGPH